MTKEMHVDFSFKAGNKTTYIAGINFFFNKSYQDFDVYSILGECGVERLAKVVLPVIKNNATVNHFGSAFGWLVVAEATKCMYLYTTNRSLGFRAKGKSDDRCNP